MTEEIKKVISTTQEEVKSAITIANKQLIVLEERLEDLSLSNDDEEAAGFREGNSAALRQLEEELEAVKVSQKLLSELLSKSQEEAVAKVTGDQSHLITVTFGDQNSGFQAGTINGGVSGLTFGGK